MAIADLAAACDRLAESTSCPAVLEDPEYRVLAYSAVPGQVEDPARSAAILRRRTPDAWLQWIATQSDGEAIDDGALHIVADPWPGLRRRAIKALRMRGEIVGYLWLLEGERGFTPDVEEAVQRFEANVLPDVAAEATLGTTRADSRLVRQAVEGSLTPEALADFFAVDGTQQALVTCFLLPGDGFTPLADVASVVDAVRSRGRQEKVALVGSSVARIDAANVQHGEDVQKRLWQSARRLQRVAKGPVFAVSRVAGDLANVASAWQEATLGADTLRRLSRTGRYAPFEDVRVAAALHVVHGAVADHRHLFDSLVEPIAGDGHSHDLKETLTTTLREEGSVSRSAAQLQLHQNSVRYRWQKIRDMLNLDIDNPDARLALRLATWRPEQMNLPGREL